jgi:hypothetical protein
MHPLALPTTLKRLIMLMTSLVFALACADAGSVMITKLSLPDDVRAAAHAAAEIAKNAPATTQTAAGAHQAAQDSATLHGVTVHTKDFTIYPDGRVTLTGGKTAPTVLLDRVPQLAHLAEVANTVTVEPLPFS